MTEFFLPILLLVITVVIALLLIKRTNENNILRTQYSGIIDVDKEIKNREINLGELESSIQVLKSDYIDKHSVYVRLETQVSLMNETLDLAEYGVYEPQFDFDTLEQFKNSIKSVRDEQKILVKNDQAVHCMREWTVEKSKTKGRAMMKRYKKLMLRAFNGECDSFMSKVKWNNVNRMKERITRAAKAVNKLGKSHEMYIVKDYADLKIKELQLTYEYEEKKHEEREEQKRIRREMREEERARFEFEQAQEEAEQEASGYENALEKVRMELEQAQEDERDEFTAQIEKLQFQLSEAMKKKERAISRAQLTKSGHVYVISNIGSFGEDVYKIGMTRRLDPLDRVRELGGASVPFKFDVHAIIFSENAPELEGKLHKAIHSKRVNLTNTRKEFFNTTLEEIETCVHENHAQIEFTKIAEAREYRETLSLRDQNSSEQKIEEPEFVFPDEL